VKVEFKVAAAFGRYFPSARAYAEGTPCEIAAAATVGDLLDSLSFPLEMAMNIFVNGRLAQRHTCLDEGDRVFIKPTTAGG